MTQSPLPTQTDSEPKVETPTAQATTAPQPSYVKLAMRNMVRKKGISLFHFALTTSALLGVLISLAFIDRYFHP
ncbi:hypothetical protein BCD67_05035 [Oscillatoriales cyanobacterium USR001]|nr:hypothetical protein BCD67_05035 [Oscillatoriales cyanobacterium USR001]